MKRIEVRLDDDRYFLVLRVSKADGVPIAAWIAQAALQAANKHYAAKVSPAKQQAIAEEKQNEAPMLAMLERFNSMCSPELLDMADDRPAYVRRRLAQCDKELPGFADWYANRNA